MFIESFKNNGVDYLRLVNSIRVQNSKGVKTSVKKVILNIGPLSRFDDGKPDYLLRLKQSFKNGKPLIDSLIPYLEDGPIREQYTFRLEEGDPECIGEPKLFSCVLLESIFQELGLTHFFTAYKGFTKIEYDLLGFVRLLVFGRVLNPASKLATTSQNNNYYEPILKDFYLYNVYDTLNFIHEHKDKIIRKINTELIKKNNRLPKIIYYDVTNFFFEIERPDDDIEQDDKIITGIRKFGVSKEERHLPLVQMGLFLDDQGVPISIEMFPGNRLDHLTVKPALKNNIDNLDYSRFIFIGDRGICNYPNIIHLLNNNNGYILSKSLKKSSNEEKQWAFNEDGYIYKSNDFKYKSRVVKRIIIDDSKNEYVINEKVVIYWSKNFYEREKADNKSFLEFLEKLQKAPAEFRVTATQSRSLKAFLKSEYINKDTGEIVSSSKLKAQIDMDKVNAYIGQMGYYQIITSELEMNPLEVIDKYHGLSRIEDQFKIMKSALNIRPIFVRKANHIEAHLLICLIALIIIRIIQNKIVNSGLIKLTEDEKKYNWSCGLSATRIQEALNKWQVDKLPNDYYRFLSINDKDLKLILDAFNIQIPVKLFRKMELKKIKTDIKIFS
mgnify:CR=1 FL=1